ncbi:MAG: hypothetical protein HZC41_19025 [Chloroflexi bacterium]|nr:hypothetical protein [Chloroflexota bacterium]
MMTIPIAESASDAAHLLRDCAFVSAELMYQPRPVEPREQHVFDFTLASRLAELSHYDAAAVLLCNAPATLDSLAHLPAAYPRLRFVAAVVNPQPLATSDPYAATPFDCGWPTPERWRRYNLTDRWARITFALDVARQLDTPGFLIMPALDAVWGQGLLALLTRLSQRHTRNGLPAAVSPYTPYQHSAVPGVDIPQPIIDALNAAFARDSWLRWRFRYGRYQSFWGKMGLLPFGMCGEILRRAETMVWEDDLELDRVIREAGFAVSCQWVGDPALYRQALPVFDHDSLRAVIERTLHYSLPIPGQFPGEKSLLNQPLDMPARLRTLVSPRFARAVALAEAIIADCNAAIVSRLEQCGASWVDWGAYRYAVRVGDPLVQVWKIE